MTISLALFYEDWSSDIFHDPLNKIEVVILRLSIAWKLLETISISFELAESLRQVFLHES